MAIDGTVLDVPDSKANARVFGYPATRPGTQAAFPKVRLVLLIEAGTHLIVDGNDSVLRGELKNKIPVTALRAVFLKRRLQAQPPFT